jgi:hypothetical protein
MTTDDENLSTEHQPKGSARNLSDTLDRNNQDVDPGQRQWNADSGEKPDAAHERDLPSDEAPAGG